MNQARKKELKDEMRSEYDLAKLKGAGRGKYVARFKASTNLILPAPDVVEYFPDEESVNSTWRSLINLAKARRRPAP